jgi:hypothetical protein
MTSYEQRIREAMLAHEDEAPDASGLSVPVSAVAGRNRRGPATPWAVSLAVFAVVIATFGVRAYVVRDAAPVARPAVTAAPVSALACPKAVPADRPADRGGRDLWVPAAPRGFDASARLVPPQVPARAIVCAYIGPRSPAGRSGSVPLTGDLSGVMNDLAWVPPAPTVGACTTNLSLTDGDYYLIGLSYPGATVWVAATGNHCGGSSNGMFYSRTSLSRQALSSYKAQRWAATPGSNDACRRSGFERLGRLGQQSSMVPGNPISVSVCEVSAADGGKATQRTETSGVERFTSALGALKTSPDGGACKPDGQPFTDYSLVFGYAEGPPVNVEVYSSCRPAIHNGSLQASDPTTVLPLIQELLHPR